MKVIIKKKIPVETAINCGNVPRNILPMVSPAITKTYSDIFLSTLDSIRFLPTIK